MSDAATRLRALGLRLAEYSALLAAEAQGLALAAALLETHEPGVVLVMIRQVRHELPKDGSGSSDSLRRQGLARAETHLEELVHAGSQAAPFEPVLDEPGERGLDPSPGPGKPGDDPGDRGPGWPLSPGPTCTTLEELKLEPDYFQTPQK